MTTFQVGQHVNISFDIHPGANDLPGVKVSFPFSRARVEALLDQIQADGEPVEALPLPRRLPDPDDECFLAAALAGKAQYLVTGNLKHYPKRNRQGVQVVSPRDFLELYRSAHG